jgi:hypothetical protein
MYCPKCDTHFEVMPAAAIEADGKSFKHAPGALIYYCPKCGTIKDVPPEPRRPEPE